MLGDEIDVNMDNKRVQRNFLTSRLSGFILYFGCAFWSLINPLKTDAVVYTIVKDQFIDHESKDQEDTDELKRLGLL